MTRVYWLEARTEFLKLARMKSYSLSTILFPLMFYCFFGLAMAPHGSAKSMASYLIATYGAFGIMGATLYAFGVGVAVERGLGWLEVKRASPMPMGAYFFAKAVVATAFGAIVILLLFTLGAVFGHVRMAPLQWVLTFGALVVGGLPFCALGLTIGNLAGPNSAPAMVNMIYLPMGFCGALWLPFDFLPKAIQQAAPLLPSYHLGQIALAIQHAPARGSIAGHTAALAAFTLIFLGTAWLAYARGREKMYGLKARMRLLPRSEDWTAYLWLVYLLYFVAAGRQAHLPATLAATAAALGIYFWSYWIRSARVLWLAGAWFVLGAIFVRVNPGASVFFVYAAGLYGNFWEPPAAFRYLAGHLVLVCLVCWALGANIYVSAPAVVFSAIVGLVVIQQEQRKRLGDRLVAAHAQAEHLAKVAERERIARDLHDLLGHTLSVIVLKSELASRLSAKQPERAAEEIRDVERISREALAQVRAAVRGYRSAGFESELRQAREALETAGIAVEARVEQPQLSAMQESVFALALREAVTNIVRHAHASMCSLSLRQNGRFFELEIADNGQGGALEEGSGLSGMRERVEALGGILERDGSNGTLLRIRVPA